MRSQEVGNGVPGGSGWFDGLRGAIRVRLCAEEEDGGGVARILRGKGKGKAGLDMRCVVGDSTEPPVAASWTRRLGTVLSSC